METNATDLDALKAEIIRLKVGAEHLRRQARWMKGVLLALIVVLLTGTLVAAQKNPAKKVVEAEEFVLKDKEGHVRGEFTVVKDSAKLELFDGDGRVRIFLTSSKELNAVVLNDEKDQHRAALAMDDAGHLGLQLFDAAGKRRADLGMGKTTSFGLRLFDSKEKQRAILSADDKQARLIFGDKSANMRASFGFAEDSPSIAILDDKEKVVFSKP